LEAVDQLAQLAGKKELAKARLSLLVASPFVADHQDKDYWTIFVRSAQIIEKEHPEIFLKFCWVN